MPGVSRMEKLIGEAATVGIATGRCDSSRHLHCTRKEVIDQYYDLLEEILEEKAILQKSITWMKAGCP